MPRLWLPQFSELASNKWKQTILELKTVPETIKMLLINHQWPISRWPSEPNVLFLHVTPSSVYKSSYPLIVGGWGQLGLWTGLSSAPVPSIASIQNKAHFLSTRAFLLTQLVKNPPAMQETWVRSLGWEDPLEKGKATHSSILAWRIPWTVKSMELQRVRQDWATFTSLHFLPTKLTSWMAFEGWAVGPGFGNTPTPPTIS